MVQVSFGPFAYITRIDIWDRVEIVFRKNVYQNTGVTLLTSILTCASCSQFRILFRRSSTFQEN